MRGKYAAQSFLAKFVLTEILMQNHLPVQHLASTGCACTAARRTARAITELYDLVLAPTGLKATQFIILQAISAAGEAAQWQLAAWYAIAPETLSRRLNAAKRKGLLEVRLGQHRGERIYRLTDGGREALAKALPYWERAQARLRLTLDCHDLASIIEVLDRITAAASAAEIARMSNRDGH